MLHADKAALELMRDMGFDDEPLNQDLLANSGNDVDRAVALLLGDEAGGGAREQHGAAAGGGGG